MRALISTNNLLYFLNFATNFITYGLKTNPTKNPPKKWKLNTKSNTFCMFFLFKMNKVITLLYKTGANLK